MQAQGVQIFKQALVVIELHLLSVYLPVNKHREIQILVYKQLPLSYFHLYCALLKYPIQSCYGNMLLSVILLWHAQLLCEIIW